MTTPKQLPSPAPMAVPPQDGGAADHRGREPVYAVDGKYRLYGVNHVAVVRGEYGYALALCGETGAKDEAESLSYTERIAAALNTPTQPSHEAGAVAEALRDLIRAYESLTRTGYERIVELGGQCDKPEMMLKGDPYLRQARAALSAVAAGDAGQRHED